MRPEFDVVAILEYLAVGAKTIINVCNSPICYRLKINLAYAENVIMFRMVLYPRI